METVIHDAPALSAAHTPPGAPPTSPREAAHEAVRLTDELRENLLARLRTLPFGAFARCVADLLEAAGAAAPGGVRAVGQRGAGGSARGKNRAGGYDLEARTAPGLLPGPRTVIAQLKQYGEGMPLTLRHVDELRGACLRTGAAGALLVSTGAASPAARAAAASPGSPLAPAVRLVDGAHLARLLARWRIGVREESVEGGGAPPALAVDAAYFARLPLRAAGAPEAVPPVAASAPPVTAPPPAESGEAKGRPVSPRSVPAGGSVTITIDVAAPAPRAPKRPAGGAGHSRQRDATPPRNQRPKHSRHGQPLPGRLGRP